MFKELKNALDLSGPAVKLDTNVLQQLNFSFKPNALPAVYYRVYGSVKLRIVVEYPEFVGSDDSGDYITTGFTLEIRSRTNKLINRNYRLMTKKVCNRDIYSSQELIEEWHRFIDNFKSDVHHVGSQLKNFGEDMLDLYDNN